MCSTIKVIDFFRGNFLYIKYAISGATAGLAQVATLYVLVEMFYVWYMYAVVAGFCAALVVGFLFQKFWTFSDKNFSTMHIQWFWYFMIALGSLSLNLVLMHFFVEVVKIWYLFAQVLTIGFVAILSFLLNKNITFKNNK